MELLARRENTWLERWPSQLAKLNVPRPATVASLLEALLGMALLLIGIVALLSF